MACEHQEDEMCMTCIECGECSESLNENDICSDCGKCELNENDSCSDCGKCYESNIA
ncbi:unnamed protein product [marine sediment metagenome]|uniref:Uncharacterized protein n=1 Tax=marine sediment metagenome TaxID=412755 RepID=X0RHS8_9ZZZZ